jgi:hypothetical protein
VAKRGEYPVQKGAREDPGEAKGPKEPKKDPLWAQKKEI